MKLSIKPFSLWLAYNVKDPQYLQTLIPPSLKLSTLKLLSDDVKSEYKLLFNAYDVKSQWMTGHRVDIQTLAVDKITNTPHLVVLDCISNTIQWDPINGITLPNINFARDQKKSNTKKYDFNLHVWNGKNRIAIRADRTGKRKIQRRFAVDANLKCYFGSYDHGFDMDFDHESIMNPVTLLNTDNIVNTFWNDVKAGNIPTHAFFHEQEMIFDVDIKDHINILIN